MTEKNKVLGDPFVEKQLDPFQQERRERERRPAADGARLAPPLEDRHTSTRALQSIALDCHDNSRK